MLVHPTVDKLIALRLRAMAKALEEQFASPDIDTLSFEERLGLLVDRELTDRETRQLKSRLRQAKLRHSQAATEDVDYRSRRGLDRAIMKKLEACQWIREGVNLLVTGPAGVGKSWLACALGQKACREGLTCQYWRVTRLFAELEVARGDGSYAKQLRALAKKHLLILDDWGLTPLKASERQDLLEILEDRYGTRSTLLTSQLPVEKWHERIGDPTFADAILDRLVHNAYRLPLEGESLRKPPDSLEAPRDA